MRACLRCASTAAALAVSSTGTPRPKDQGHQYRRLLLLQLLRLLPRSVFVVHNADTTTTNPSVRCWCCCCCFAPRAHRNHEQPSPSPELGSIPCVSFMNGFALKLSCSAATHSNGCRSEVVAQRYPFQPLFYSSSGPVRADATNPSRTQSHQHPSKLARPDVEQVAFALRVPEL